MENFDVGSAPRLSKQEVGSLAQVLCDQWKEALLAKAGLHETKAVYPEDVHAQRGISAVLKSVMQRDVYEILMEQDDSIASNADSVARNRGGLQLEFIEDLVDSAERYDCYYKE